MNVAKALGRGAFLLAVSNILCNVIEFLTTLVIIRILSPSSYGLFTLAFSILMLFQGFTNFGLDTTFVRYVAFYRGAKKGIKEKQAIALTVVIKVSISLLLMALLLFSKRYISEGMYANPELSPLLVHGSALIVLFTAVAISLAILQAYKQIYSYSLMTLGDALIRFLLILGALYLSPTPLSVVWAFVLSKFFILVISLFAIRKVVPPGIRFSAINVQLLKEMLPYSAAIYVMGALKAIWERSSFLLLGLFSTTLVVGYYTFAYKLAAIFISLSVALDTILLPYLSEFTAGGKKDAIKDSINLSVRYLAIMVAPIIVGGICFSTELIGLLGKHEYIGAAPIFALLAVMSFFRTLSHPLQSIFLAIDKLRLSIYCNVLMVTVNIASILLLFRYFDFYAVPIANIVTMICLCAYLYVIVGREINGLEFPVLRPILAGGAMFGVMKIAFGLLRWPIVMNLLVAGLIGVVGYVLILAAIGGITIEDVRFIKRNML